MVQGTVNRVNLPFYAVRTSCSTYVVYLQDHVDAKYSSIPTGITAMG